MSFRSVRRHAVMTVAGAALATATLVPAVSFSTAADAVTAKPVATQSAKAVKKTVIAKPRTAKQMAKDLARQRYGWKSKQFSCLTKLWHRESGWRVQAGNSNGGPYGIPQAYPGHKMGKGWKTSANTQITWGLRYIDGRYDTPCKADRTQRTRGWY